MSEYQEAEYQEAIASLEVLPAGWKWSINKYGEWYSCIIANHGLKHEPCYTSGDNMGRISLLAAVQAACAAYHKGECSQSKGSAS